MTESLSSWTFFTNHAHVLICLASQPNLRLRDVARKVGITERAVQRIVAELVEAGILIRRREGRRNIYKISRKQPLRHDVEKHCTVGQMLALIIPDTD